MKNGRACAAVRISSHAPWGGFRSRSVLRRYSPRRARVRWACGAASLVRACGAREIGHGCCRSPQRRAGLWSRVGGDTLDIAALAVQCAATTPSATMSQPHSRWSWPSRCSTSWPHKLTPARHSRRKTEVGITVTARVPQGLERARDAARNVDLRADMRPSPQSAQVSPAADRVRAH